MNWQEAKPTRKVGSGLLGGALTVILLFLFELQWENIEIPAAVASAVTVVVTFAVSWWVPSDA